MSVSLQLLDPTATASISPNDLLMSKTIAEALHEAYPGQRWAITCDSETGIITIRNLWLSGTWGYLMKIKEIYSASQLRHDVLVAGGEVMERFNMMRGRFDESRYHQMKTNFAGQLEFDRK